MRAVFRMNPAPWRERGMADGDVADHLTDGSSVSSHWVAGPFRQHGR